MLKNYFLFLFFFFIQQASAQVTISGTLIDAKSKAILYGVNVYINNTSIGTVSDSTGKFSLKAPDMGNIELVLSHLVYQKKIVMVLPEKRENLLIEMNFQNNMLNEVVIKGKKTSKSNSTRWTELFSMNLIGRYSGVNLSCKIKNPEVLSFDYDSAANQLQVFARRPLLIENEELGYLIRLELDEFIYNFMTDDIVFKYSLFFENMIMSRVRVAQVAKKRKSLYQGSNMHFMRSLFNNSVEQEGFKIYKYNAIQHVERARVEKIIRKKIAYNYAHEKYPKLDIFQLFSSLDTINYYRNVMKENRIIRFDTLKLASSEVRKPNADWTMVNFNAKDTLMIYYDKKNLVLAKAFASANEVKSKTQISSQTTYPRSHSTKYSYLYFFNKEGINIQSNGYYPELGVFVYGDMGERRLAGILPFDYDPDEEL